MTSIETKITEINGILTQQNTELDNTVNKIASLQNATNPTIEDYQQRLTWLLPNLDAMLKNIEGKRGELKEAKEELNTLENSDMKKLKELKKKLKKQEKKLEKLNDRLKTNQNFLSNLEADNRHPETQEKIKKTIKKQEKKVRQWSNSIDNIKGEIAKISADREEEMKVKEKMKKLTGDIDLLKKEISRYDKAIWSSNQIIEEEKAKIAKQNAVPISDAQEEKKQIQNNIQSKTTELTKYQAMLDEVKGFIVQANTDLAKAQEDLTYHGKNCNATDTVMTISQTSYDVGDTIRIEIVDPGYKNPQDNHKNGVNVVGQGQYKWIEIDSTEQSRCHFVGEVVLTADVATGDNEFQAKSGDKITISADSYYDIQKGWKTGQGDNVFRVHTITIN